MEEGPPLDAVSRSLKPVGAGSDLDDQVRHAAGQDVPHLPGELEGDLLDGDAESEELVHRLMGPSTGCRAGPCTR